MSTVCNIPQPNYPASYAVPSAYSLIGILRLRIAQARDGDLCPTQARAYAEAAYRHYTTYMLLPKPPKRLDTVHELIAELREIAQ